MYRKDQIKVALALTLLAIMGLLYWLTEDKELVGYVSIACLFAWLIGMYFLNRSS